MATIKEKSEEHLKSVYAGYDDVLKKLVKEGFEAGANYVLECLERAIELNESTFVYTLEKYIKVEVLNKLIEQLKK